MLLKVSKNQIEKKKSETKKIKCYFTNKSKINKNSFTLKNHLKKKMKRLYWISKSYQNALM